MMQGRRPPLRVVALAGFAASAALALGAPLRSSAATFEGLYSTLVELDPAAADRRDDATRRALARVLMRVSGDRDAPRAPELQPVIASAERSFLNSYATLEGGRVRVGFAPGAVNEALERAGWPVWGPERPSTMLWVAVDNGFGDRSILGAGEPVSRYERSEEMQGVMETLLTELEETADERGLVYTLPELDLTDIVNIDFADVWGGYEDALERASERYSPDVIVTARVRNSPIGMDVEWTVHGADAGSVLLGAGFREGLDWIADRYAAQFGVFGGSRPLTLTIDGVRTYADYGRVMSYLDSVSMLERVDAVSLDGRVLTLEVLSRGGEDVLIRVLGLSNVVAPARGAPNRFGPPALEFVVTDPVAQP